MSDKKTRRVRGKLDLSNSKLDTLLEITNTINDNPSEEDLFELFENILVRDLLIGRFILFTNTTNWEEALTFGLTKKEAKAININSIVKKYSTIDSLNSEQTEGFIKTRCGYSYLS